MTGSIQTLFLSALVAFSSLVSAETNAERFARGVYSPVHPANFIQRGNGNAARWLPDRTRESFAKRQTSSQVPVTGMRIRVSNTGTPSITYGLLDSQLTQTVTVLGDSVLGGDFQALSDSNTARSPVTIQPMSSGSKFGTSILYNLKISSPSGGVMGTQTDPAANVPSLPGPFPFVGATPYDPAGTFNSLNPIFVAGASRMQAAGAPANGTCQQGDSSICNSDGYGYNLVTETAAFTIDYVTGKVLPVWYVPVAVGGASAGKGTVGTFCAYGVNQNTAQTYSSFGPLSFFPTDEDCLNFNPSGGTPSSAGTPVTLTLVSA